MIKNFFKKVNTDKLLQKRHQGFTLAEVLITLGIIGVIAAITIPQLLMEYQNIKNSALLKEDYAIMQQMMLMANDNGAIGSLSLINGDNEEEMETWFKTYILPNIKVTEVCYAEWGCWSKEVKDLKGRNITNYQQCGTQTISFILPNGSYACMDDTQDNRFGVLTDDDNIRIMGILVDVNGAGKPNVLGKDIFVMAFKNGELLPGGQEMTPEEIEKNCSTDCSNEKLFYCGSFCLTKAKKQGFKLPVVKK